MDRRVIADVLPLLRESRFALDLELLVRGAPARVHEDRRGAGADRRAVREDHLAEGGVAPCSSTRWPCSGGCRWCGPTTRPSRRCGLGRPGRRRPAGTEADTGPPRSGASGRGRASQGGTAARAKPPPRPYTRVTHASQVWEGPGATRPDRHPQRRPCRAPRCGEDDAGRGAVGGHRRHRPAGLGGEGHDGHGLRARGGGAPAVHLDEPGALHRQRREGEPAGHARLRRLRRRDDHRAVQRRPGRRRGQRHRRRAGADRGRLAGGGRPRACRG